MTKKLATRHGRGAIAAIALAATVLCSCGKGASDTSAANRPAGIPHDVPKAAAKAMDVAHGWRKDAQLIDLTVKQSNGYAIEFNFLSADGSTFYVTDNKGHFTSQAFPPVTTSATPDPLPLKFMDLPAAVAKATEKGMPPVLKQAELQASSSETPELAWALQPVAGDGPQLYTVVSATGAVITADDSDAFPSDDSGSDGVLNVPNRPK